MSEASFLQSSINVRAVRLMVAAERYIEKPWSRKRFLIMKSRVESLREIFPNRLRVEIELKDHFGEPQSGDGSG